MPTRARRPATVLLATAVLALLAATVTVAVREQRAAGAAEKCHPDAARTVTDRLTPPVVRTLTRLTCDDGVAVYGDAGVRALPDAATGWVARLAADQWRHLRERYGDCRVRRVLPAPVGPGCQRFGDPKPLTVLLTTRAAGDRAVTGRAGSRFDGDLTGSRNTVAVSAADWSDSAVLRDVLTRETCRLVDGAGQGVAGSPAAAVWGDGAWADYCQFDFYAGTGRTGDAARVFDRGIAGTDAGPPGSAAAAWFRDWFLPLWVDGGRGPATMNRFFGLLSRYFPTGPGGDRTLAYTRTMDVGEFVHFSSAAAGRDLSPRAAAAFGAGFDRARFDRARRAFRELTYPPAPCTVRGTPCPAVAVTDPGVRTGEVGTPVAVPVRAAAPGGDLRHTATGLPAGLRIDERTGVVSGTPTEPGTSFVSVAVTGAGANEGRTAFRWDVADWRGPLVGAGGLCADNASSITDTGNPVRTWPCNGTAAQAWSGAGGRIRVQDACLRAAGAAEGAAVVVGPCADGPRWELDPATGAVRHADTGRCLTSPRALAGLVLAACTGDERQRWRRPAR